MGLLDYFARRKALTASPEVLEAANAGYYSSFQKLGGTNQQVVNAWEQAQTESYGWLYRQQPAVRTVVDFIATNLAQLPLKLYERLDDNEREQLYDAPAARTMRLPYDKTPQKRWVFDFVADFLVYDNAYAIKFKKPDGTITLVRIPPHMMGLVGSSRFTVDGYRVHRFDGSVYPAHDQMLPPETVIHLRGYNPDDPRIGISKLETLRQILAEEAAAVASSTELLKSGLQKPAYVYRPLEAPAWSNPARESFEADLYNRVVRSDKRWPVLEEGMELRDMGITPKDAQVLESRRFTLETVARQYGMETAPPDNEEDRQAFYSDVLAPLTELVAECLDHSLLQVEYAEDDQYFEFMLEEKLRGDPVKRFQAITAAVGAPWLLRDEARAMMNLNQVDGGDKLIKPLNVIEEGEESPRLPAPNVMPPQDPNKPPADGSYRENGAGKAVDKQTKALMHPRRAAQSHRRDLYAEEITEVFAKNYERQRRAVVSKGIKAPYEQARWDKELAEDLEPAFQSVLEREGDVVAQRLGLIAFNAAVVRNWVKAVAADVAAGANAVIAANLKVMDTAEVFAQALTHAATGGQSLATNLSNFAGETAAEQTPDADVRRKVWVVTSDDSAHPELDGETVGVGEKFSIGVTRPPAEHVGCQCLIEIQ